MRKVFNLIRFLFFGLCIGEFILISSLLLFASFFGGQALSEGTLRRIRA